MELRKYWRIAQGMRRKESDWLTLIPIDKKNGFSWLLNPF
jgi:hypothetical protein